MRGTVKSPESVFLDEIISPWLLVETPSLRGVTHLMRLVELFQSHSIVLEVISYVCVS